MYYSWKCPSCGAGDVYDSGSADQYFSGFAIYGEHQERSPCCTNLSLKIIEFDAGAFIPSGPFQSEVGRVVSLGGFVEVHNNTITLYRGVMPRAAIDLFADRLHHLDQSRLLDIIISTKDRP